MLGKLGFEARASCESRRRKGPARSAFLAAERDVPRSLDAPEEEVPHAVAPTGVGRIRDMALLDDLAAASSYKVEVRLDEKAAHGNPLDARGSPGPHFRWWLAQEDAMNGAKRIRAACCIWYIFGALAFFAGIGILQEHVPPYMYGRELEEKSAAVASNHVIGLWMSLSFSASLPFAFLIHLLAAIWETLIGMALQSEARTEPRPPPEPSPQA